MSKWSGFEKATIIEIDTYTECYNSTQTILSGYAYRIKPGTKIGVQYDEEKDAMLITSCSTKKEAVGKYIIECESFLDISDEPQTTEARTTTDENTGNETPENTDSNGETSGSNTSIISQIVQMDDTFVSSEYTKTYTDTEEYYNNLQNGLRVKDLRGILGMPHQFLPIADPRIDETYEVGDNNAFGRVYSEKIIKNIPLLLMTPGVPTFMTGFSAEQKEKVIGKLINFTTETFDSIFSDNRTGKYYSLKYAYTEYFYYVNAMLRSAAHFLEIHDEKIDGKKLGTLNWLYQTSTMGSDIFSHGNLANFLGPYAGCIAFYADAGNTVDDSFSNSTTESQLSSMMNGLSDQGRELNFILGNAGGALGIDLDFVNGGQINDTLQDITQKISGVIGKNNIISNLLNTVIGKGGSLLTGGRIYLPEIWSDSSFSRSYSCSMKLVSPSGDKLSVFLNILVPIYHLLGFTLPRQSITQTYFSPFLVRAYYKGLFNVDMGIIQSLSITKGDEGEWTIDGIPTVANVTFEIKDLYDGLYMSKQSLKNDYSIMSNIAELDYIANSCGVNVNDQEVMRTVRMYTALGFSGLSDKVTIGIFGNIAQYFNQKVQNIFGAFK